MVTARTGLSLHESHGANLESGLADVIRHSPRESPDGILAWSAALPDEHPEWQRLVHHLTVGETWFFRDRACFDALEHHVLAPLIAERRAAGLHWLRLWSAGCATGEEPYSLAIVVDRLLPDRSDWSVTVLGTDIDTTALDIAAAGVYRHWALRETPRHVVRDYFHDAGAGRFRIDERIRSMVTLGYLNLAAGDYPSPTTNTAAIDVIVCRNVLMYLTPEAQRSASRRLARSLTPHGWLIVAPAEAAAHVQGNLAPVSFPEAIFYRLPPRGGDGASALDAEPAERAIA